MAEDTTCPTCGREDFKSELGVKFHHSKTHGESLSNQIFTCDYCGEEFTAPKHSRQEKHTFCNQECSSSWMSENIVGENNVQYKRVSVECDYCDDAIKIPPNREDEYEHNFCNKDCKYNWMSEEFQGSNHHNYNKREYICDNCGDNFESIPSHRPQENKFCNRKCHTKYRKTITGEEHPLYRGGHSSGFTQSERNEIFQRDNYTCQECGDSEHKLHAHHIIPVHKDNEKEHDIDNGITLCINCHANKHPELSDLILSKKT